MMGEFRVSTVIPAHNGLPDVLDAIASALAQTHPPAEIVLVDDGSTDGTADAVRARFGPDVRVVAGRFGGAAAARNAGWRAATSPWIALLDADDLWFPNKLATAAALLLAHPGAAWFFSDGAFRTLDGHTRDSWLADYADLPDPYIGQPVGELFDVNFVLTSSVIVRRDALETTGGFDETMSHAEDLDLWIRLARRWPAVGCGRSLVRYQHRPGGLTRQVEARLRGDATLFHMLGTDAALSPMLRDRARRREGLSRYKLAITALREGRMKDARSFLAGTWLLPGRALPVAAAWAASLLPAPAFAWLRRSSWAKRNVASPMVRLRRVVLTSSGSPPAGRLPGGAA